MMAYVISQNRCKSFLSQKSQLKGNVVALEHYTTDINEALVISKEQSLGIMLANDYPRGYFYRVKLKVKLEK